MDNSNLPNDGGGMPSIKSQAKSWPNVLGQTFPAKVGFKDTVEDGVIAVKSTGFKEEEIAGNYDNDSIDDTGPSCPFKDMALLYVAATEDEDLGRSILAMSKDIWQKIANEGKLWENFVANLSGGNTNDVREKVAEEF